MCFIQCVSPVKYKDRKRVQILNDGVILLKLPNVLVLIFLCFMSLWYSYLRKNWNLRQRQILLRNGVNALQSSFQSTWNTVVPSPCCLEKLTMLSESLQHISERWVGYLKVWLWRSHTNTIQWMTTSSQSDLQTWVAC